MNKGDDGIGDLPGGPLTVAIRNFEGELVRLRQGTLTNNEFRPIRTILGVYGQRQPEEYVVRVRIPYGELSAEQLRCLAQVAREYGNSIGHVTTRQNMQLHWIKLDKIPEVLWRLARVGLTSLQSGGNSVRTVAACPLAGVCPKEVFDVRPYARVLDSYFLGNEAVMQLPRKFKMAFSGCPADCAYTRIQDFGAVARVQEQNGTLHPGFQVWVGGGMGVFPRLAQPLEEFVPEEEILATCEAVLRLFDQLGDRRNKHKARLKFLLIRLGIEEFRRLVREERKALDARKRELPPPIPAENDAPANAAPRDFSRAPFADPGYEQWHRWNVLKQRQEGYSTVLIPLKLGDVTAEQMEVVAEVAGRYAGGTLRTSQQQDIVLPGVPDDALPAVYLTLRSVDLTRTRAWGIADVTACPGTSACSLAITSSKGLARQLVSMLKDASYQEDETLGALRIKVSGCPDSCGHHWLADIGLYGCAMHDGERLYPAYQLLLGGEVTEQGTRLARPVMKLPARKVPQAIATLLRYYQSSRIPNEQFSALVDRVGLDAFRQLLAEFTHIPPPEEDPSNFIDWDSTRMYILERGEGECAT